MSYFLGENCDGKNGHRMKLPVKTAPRYISIVWLQLSTWSVVRFGSTWGWQLAETAKMAPILSRLTLLRLERKFDWFDDNLADISVVDSRHGLFFDQFYRDSMQKSACVYNFQSQRAAYLVNRSPRKKNRYITKLSYFLDVFITVLTSGIVVACLCVFRRVCVCQSVCQLLACPHHNSGPVQARITKFGTKVQNNLIKVPIVLWSNWH